MKGVFVVLAAIAACALARSEILNYICSVSATGVATIEDVGEFQCRMARVRNTVRYDFLGSNSAVIGSYIIRPDLDYCFLYLPNIMPGNCDSSYTYVSLDSYYNSGTTKEGYTEFYCSSSYKMYFNGTSLAKEHLNVYNYDITINYTSVNYNFEHNELDDFFSLNDANCPEASSKAAEASSFRLCSYAEVPDYMCSVSGTGTGVLSSSSGGGVRVDVTMYRVKNSVRFELKDKNYQIPYATLVQRRDQYATYLYNSSDQSCNECYNRIFPTGEYIETTEDRLDVFGYEEYRWWFNHDTHEFVKESLKFGSYTLTINYTSVNHDYTREANDNTFSLNYDSCPDDAKDKSPHLLSSVQCSPKKVIKPKVPGCSFVMTVKAIGEDHYFFYYFDIDSYDVKVIMKDNEVYGFKAILGNSSILLRCDIKDERGRCLYVSHLVVNYGYYGYGYDYDLCYDDGFLSAKDQEDFIPLFDFEYTGEPEDVKCPDKSSGCKKYCDYSEDMGSGECRVFDKEGQIVQVEDSMAMEYKKADIPSIELEGVLCTGGILQGPDYSCSGDGSLSFSSSTFTIPSILLFILAFLFAFF